jgi:acyl-CoA synthetase (AMP-forming)/AMP-acid ligase II
VITSSAYRIGPFEVESALIEHPAVMEAAVVGKDDDERTQIVVAFVILAPGYTASAELARELQDHVKGNTAPYKYPREIHFLPSCQRRSAARSAAPSCAAGSGPGSSRGWSDWTTPGPTVAN